MLLKALIELLAVWAITLFYSNKSCLLSSKFKYSKVGTSICPICLYALILSEKNIGLFIIMALWAHHAPTLMSPRVLGWYYLSAS
jgi:hypothetical protein